MLFRSAEGRLAGWKTAPLVWPTHEASGDAVPLMPLTIIGPLEATETRVAVAPVLFWMSCSPPLLPNEPDSTAPAMKESWMTGGPLGMNCTPPVLVQRS